MSLIIPLLYFGCSIICPPAHRYSNQENFFFWIYKFFIYFLKALLKKTYKWKPNFILTSFHWVMGIWRYRSRFGRLILKILRIFFYFFFNVLPDYSQWNFYNQNNFLSRLESFKGSVKSKIAFFTKNLFSYFLRKINFPNRFFT